MAKGRVLLFASSLLLLLLLVSGASSAVDLRGCGLTAIYNFGDSLSDVGNAEIEFSDPHGWKYPLGMTIGRATGRFCDGLLIIDRIAEAAGLPYTNPYRNMSLGHSKGANFAVGGTGILSKEQRRKWNVRFKYSNSSLDVQLNWFRHFIFMHKNFKNETARRQHLKSSLFVTGGGGNDYGSLVWRNDLGYVEQKKLIMPDIMRNLKNAVKEFIKDGANKVIMSGVYEGGCLPSDKNTDNLLHCDKETNRYHIIHNNLLQKQIRELRKEFPSAHIVYGNVWDANQWVFDHYASLGFKYLQKRCCGTDEDDAKSRYCGFDGIPYCKHPSEHVFWDGLHFTDASYKYMFQRMMPQISKGLQCNKQAQN